MIDRIRQFLKFHRLWLGLGAVAIPLALLLGLQLKWLSSLERTSAIAEKAWLSNYIEAVSSEAEFFYRAQAERTLNIPDELFGRSESKLAAHLRKKTVEGVRAIFVTRFDAVAGPWDGLLVFDPVRSAWVEEADDETIFAAIDIALSPWEILAHKGVLLTTHNMTVDEKDPANRIILSPISDDACRVIGVAGLVLDTDFFSEELLPRAIEKSLPKFFDERTQRNLVITVRDREGQAVIGPSHVFEHEEEVVDGLTFVFSDWTLGLGSRGTTSEQWARTNFLLNLSLTVALAVVLLGGITFMLRTASREVRLSRMKSEFVSNVSHELRTPLASIRVFGEFLRLGRVQDVEKSRKYGEYIENESHRLTQLINNILDFSKIESGAKQYDLEPTDLDEIVRESVQTWAVSLKHRGVHLRYEAPPLGASEIVVDGDAIRQALANLVDNAVKYSGDGKEIVVSLRREQDRLILSVRDEGIGISRSEQHKIFERFHRVGTGLVHDVKGSGLGLSIVQHIVLAHGGEILVDSEPGQGSTFSIRLPLEVSARQAQAVDLDRATQLGET
jgi:signal transduction histidine kinase